MKRTTPIIVESQIELIHASGNILQPSVCQITSDTPYKVIEIRCFGLLLCCIQDLQEENQENVSTEMKDGLQHLTVPRYNTVPWYNMLLLLHCATEPRRFEKSRFRTLDLLQQSEIRIFILLSKYSSASGASQQRF